MYLNQMRLKQNKMEGNSNTKLGELQKKLKNENGCCVKCGKRYYLTVDHIIPQSMLEQLNLIDERYNWEDNFQVICGACNALKGGRLDLSNPKIRKFKGCVGLKVGKTKIILRY